MSGVHDDQPCDTHIRSTTRRARVRIVAVTWPLGHACLHFCKLDQAYASLQDVDCHSYSVDTKRATGRPSARNSTNIGTMFGLQWYERSAWVIVEACSKENLSYLPLNMKWGSCWRAWGYHSPLWTPQFRGNMCMSNNFRELHSISVKLVYFHCTCVVVN